MNIKLVRLELSRNPEFVKELKEVKRFPYIIFY